MKLEEDKNCCWRLGSPVGKQLRLKEQSSSGCNLFHYHNEFRLQLSGYVLIFTERDYAQFEVIFYFSTDIIAIHSLF